MKKGDPDLDYALCGICKRKGFGMGYRCDARGARPLWLCEPCIPLGKKAYHMKRAVRDDMERTARDDGGGAAGRFLDLIGKTDLATLTPEEWAQFLDIFLEGYEHSMREQMRAMAPPF